MGQGEEILDREGNEKILMMAGKDDSEEQMVKLLIDSDGGKIS